MPRITIHVLPDHIGKGKRMNPNCCPIAMALEQRLKKDVYCSVEEDEIALYDETGDVDDLYTVVKLAPEDKPAVEKFIEEFDNGKKVEPFSFSIDIPEWALPLKQVAPRKKRRNSYRNGSPKTNDTSTVSPETTTGVVQ